MALEAGTKAPEVTLEAAVSKRHVTPAAGTRQVWVFHGPKTTEAPKEVGKAVRAEHDSAEQVLVCNIVDLRSMSGMWQKVAKAGVEQNYKKMAAKLEAKGMDPVDYVVICPDWDGEVADAFGFDDTNKTPAVAVLDADGAVVGAVQGDGLAEQALGWLE